jgi:GalNAc-alpha-(1->4)-GalNAc-alpha-(1->3)-diNAcBac-PP-undecaprenol alpha-1,4-N-acetyl-D-galactosaminyltransferase
VNKISYFIISPGLSMGGVERASTNTANGLIQIVENESVFFLSIFKKNWFFNLNENVSCIEPKGFNLKSLHLLKTIFYIRSNVLILKKNHLTPKILCFGKFYGALTCIALLGIKVEIFISDRNSPLFHWKFPFNAINKIAYTLNPPKGVIAQTQIAAEYQKKYFSKSKVTVIPNSVREVQLYPEIHRQKVILAVGRLNDHLKGFDLLLESIALLKNQDWELHIAGGDENGEALKNQADKLGIRHRVKFLGAVKDIDRCYAYAGIYVIPSRSEGFPNALAEAMAAGCCCVAFDFVAGPRDLINHNNNGILVPYLDVKSMAKTIDELIVDEKKRVFLEKNVMEVRDKLKQSVIVENIKVFLENEE